MRYGGESYEVGTVRTDYWLLDARYGRDMAKHNACGWRRKQIHAQSRPTTLECNEAYLQISRGHTRLRRHIRTKQTLRPTSLHRLRLRGFSRQLEINISVLLHIRAWCHFVEIETEGLYGYEHYRRGDVCHCV